jgi:hypothetical protein
MSQQLPLAFERMAKPRRRPSYHVRAHQTVPEVLAGEALEIVLREDAAKPQAKRKKGEAE